MSMHTIAVILAGGTGARFSQGVPKQFVNVGGSPLIAYSINAFEQNTGIDEIAVVLHADYVQQFKTIAAQQDWKKTKKIIIGGDKRSDSTLAALQAYADVSEAKILFHDAARPLVTQRIIDDTIAALETCKAATVAIPSTDTILQTDDTRKYVAHIPARSLLRRVQTPQGFHLSVIRQAYGMAMKDAQVAATDDCGVVHRYLSHEKIALVEGDERNFKITYPEDLRTMEEFCNA